MARRFGRAGAIVNFPRLVRMVSECKRGVLGCTTESFQRSCESIASRLFILMGVQQLFGSYIETTRILKPPEILAGFAHIQI